jgi:hypothetical protein
MRLLPHGNDELFAFYDIECVARDRTLALVWRTRPNLSYFLCLVVLILLTAIGSFVSVYFKIYSIPQAITYFFVCAAVVIAFYLMILRIVFARRRSMPPLIDVDTVQGRIVKCRRSESVVGCVPRRIVWLRGTLSTSRSASTVLEPVAQILVECEEPSKVAVIGSVRRMLGATPPKEIRSFCKKIGIECVTEVATPDTVDHHYWNGTLG